ncbi:MAG TPA: sulfatase-like hydrolase/transferase [Pelobium sp.]|nr:sulfatase-like hydrolase/transferase [Pelobium sp.]
MHYSKDYFKKVLCFSICLLANTFLVFSQTQKPNIIFILTDDQRWDALGYAGNKYIHTPEMDKLAKEGAYFKNAFASTPICAASRASIITGLYERTHKYNFSTSDIKDEYMQNAYPLKLREAGYYTGFFGKFGVNYDGLNKLYDVYDSYDRKTSAKDSTSYYYKTINKKNVHLTRYTGQQALDFIDQAPKDQPFCLQLSFSAPHANDASPDQYFWQEENNYLFQDVKMPPAKLASDKYFNELPTAVKVGFNRLRWTWRFDDPEKYQKSVKGYYRMIAGIDNEIAKIRAELKAKGLDKNTIIIFMSDNGYFLGERQLADKWLMYDNSLRVPLMIMDPRNPTHRDVDEMALNLDVPATILDYAGVKQPKSWHGESLKPLVQGKAEFDRDTILIEHIWQFTQIPPSEGLRTSDWKYFRYVDDHSLEYLYHIKADPMETKNLASSSKYKTKLLEFRKKLEQLIIKYQDPYSGVPSGLTVNFFRPKKGVVIGDNQPVFSWIVPKEAVNQKAYQILVSSSKEKSDLNQGDIWDSREVRSIETANIDFKGKPLSPGTKYFWKVRIWDQDNRTSAYSEAQQFELISQKNVYNHPSIFEIDSVKPLKVEERNGKLFLDFNKDAFATLSLNYKTDKQETLFIRLGEQLNADGTINNQPGKSTIRSQDVKLLVNPKQTYYQIELKPDKRNTLPQAAQMPKSFPVIMPFRYVEISGNSQKIEREDVTQLRYHTYFDDNASSFHSSNDILNQVWEMCKYTIKATSFTGVYVDGDRERIPYEADAYLNQLSHYTTDREYNIAKNTIEYFMQYPTWPTEWQLHVALMLEADYLYSGSTELIEEYYEPLKYKTLMDLVDDNGLISTKSPKLTKEFMKKLGFKDSTTVLKDITDWPPAQKDTGWKLATAEGERDGFVFMPYNTLINSLYVKNMEIMAEFAKILNKSEEEADFRLRALKAKMAINQKMLDKTKGYYNDGIGTDHSSIHANMFALAFNIVPPENIKPVVDFIKSRGMACSVYGAQYLMEALYNAKEADYALSLMTSTSDRSWYNMIRVGATMAMEAWDMKYKPNSDWNHAWGAVPANAIPRLMWGIQPKTPGGSIIEIKPQLSTLTKTNIKVPFLNGEVCASYKKEGLKQLYTFEIPANMAANLILNYSPNDAVTLNGETVNLSFGSIRLNPGINKIELKVNTF